MGSDCDRREFLTCVSAATVSSAVAPLGAAERKPKIVRKTYTFKTVGTLALKADVYRPDDDAVRPVLLWLHGGALILGGRASVDRRLRDRLLDVGFVVVSIDYRLAPETKLPEIIRDIEDGYAWLHERGRELFHADTRRIVVAGGSAGGYLTLTAGFRAKPRPAALVSLWGYGDLVGPWYSQPSAFYRRQPLVPKEDVMPLVTGPAVANSADNRDQRRKFYLYCRQNGLWPKLVAGFDPHSEAKKFAPYEPVRNVSKDYPPTLLVHGTKDTDVPYEQSVMMAERHGVEHRLVTVRGAGHGLSGGDRERVDRAYDSAVAFVKGHAVQYRSRRPPPP